MLIRYTTFVYRYPNIKNITIFHYMYDRDS